MVLFFIAAFIAEVLGTIAGFGSSTILMPIALLFYDFPIALTLVAFYHLFGNIGRITLFRKPDMRLLLAFGLPSVLLSFAGAALVMFIAQEMLKLVLGAFLVLYAAGSLSMPAFQLPRSRAASIIGGSISGLFAGLIGTGGALRGAFLSMWLEKAKYITTAAIIALAVDATRIPVYLASGFLSAEFYWMLPVLFVIALAGAYIGRGVVHRIPQAMFRNVALVAIALAGLKLIADSLA